MSIDTIEKAENDVKRKFDVIENIKCLIEYNKNNNQTAHLEDRKNRLTKIEDELNELDEVPLYQFVVDTGHYNGLEVHQINSNGTIDIFNKRSGRYVTTLIARPKQIKRYFTQQEIKIPKALVNLAYDNRKKGANTW